jgi:hypothetical protein
MPVFQNISVSDLYLPREDGLKPDLRLLPGATFSGSTAFYGKYVGSPQFLIQRLAQGFPFPAVVTSGPNTLTVNVDGYFGVNAVIATAADHTAFGTPVVATTAYTAFGTIVWYEGVTKFTQTFSCNSGSGFVFSSVVPAGSTSSAASGTVILKEGTIAFGLNGATMTQPVVSVVYEPLKQGWRGPTYTNPLLDSACYTTKQSVNANNQILSKTVFYTGSEIGDPKKVTTMVYTGTQTQPDTIVESIGLVTAADLNF